MMIEREYHPELIVSTDPTRYALRHACVVDRLPGDDAVGYSGWLIATNGVIAMFVPVQLAAADELGPVRGDLCQLAKRAGGKGPYNIRLGARHIRTADGVIYPRLLDQGRGKVEYPDLEKHLLSKLSTAAVPVGWVNFRVNQLTCLLKGLGAESATLEFHGSQGSRPGPCRVKVVNKTLVFGLIMPERG